MYSFFIVLKHLIDRIRFLRGLYSMNFNYPTKITYFYYITTKYTCLFAPFKTTEMFIFPFVCLFTRRVAAARETLRERNKIKSTWIRFINAIRIYYFFYHILFHSHWKPHIFEFDYRGKTSEAEQMQANQLDMHNVNYDISTFWMHLRKISREVERWRGEISK